jgi:hypothetical protein
MPTPRLTNEIITAAIEGYESQKTRIDGKIAELKAMLPGGTTEPVATPEPTKRKRKKFSAASRRKMAMAQKARRAKTRGESAPTAPDTPESSKPKRKLSKAGKAAIVAALKKRWALKRAEAAKAKPAKKTARKKGAVKKAAAKTTATTPTQPGTQAAVQ